MSLSASYLEMWATEGWVHIPRVYSERQVAEVNRLVDVVWETKPRNITVDDVDLMRRATMASIGPESRSHRTKIGDLYLSYRPIRDLLLLPEAVRFLSAALADEPVLENSLNMENGSAQDFHVDSLFMTPLTPGGVVAWWVALEDVRPGAGPLRLYAKSHLIPPFRFSDGSVHAISSELSQWGVYMQGELDRRGLRPESVYPRAGDVIAWNADTVHGSEPIADSSTTRKSMVGHYFRLREARRRGYKIRRHEGSLWVDRRPQPVNVVTRGLCAVERRVQNVRGLLRQVAAPDRKRG